jgi:selenocysteine lyase/cysteine desulfurase
VAYLNAGTCGPIADASVQATHAEVDEAARKGRAGTHFLHVLELQERRRAAYAERVGAGPDDIALTTSTSEGIVRVLAALDLRAGQEIVTSDEEHPGLLGPLAAARDRLGVEVRAVPWTGLADAVGPDTALVACSHVSWVTGAVCPPALAELDIPVLLDGAQGIGAVPVDVRALGADLYAGSGQKWLCGPVGTGMLYVAPELRERFAVTTRGYGSFTDNAPGIEAPLHVSARANDRLAAATDSAAFAVAAVDTLAAYGWDAVHEAAAALAGRFADELAARGRDVLPRDATTLVTFRSDDAEAERNRLAEAGVVVRDLPGRGAVRVSAGAWNDESDLERFLTAIG